MRVAILTTHLPPVLGGIEVHCANLARALVARGHEVMLIGSLESGQSRKLRIERLAEGVEVYRVPAVFLRGLRRPTRLLAMAQTVRHMHQRRPIDILHAHQLYPVGVCAALLSSSLRLPLIITEHGSVLDDAKRPIRRQLLRWAGQRAAQVLTASSELGEAVVAAGIDRGKVASMPNAVGAEALTLESDRATCRRALGLPEDAFLAMTVRRLVPKTGIRYAVLAVPRCVASIPKFRLCVVGAGPERAKLEALAMDLGVRDRVCFVGAVENARVPLYMRAADLGVFPSLAEATSIAALEFMAAGTPVAASSVGGLVEIIEDGIDGFLFDFGFSRSRYDDPGLPDEAVEAVAASIVRAYRSDLSRIGREAIRRVQERHTWDSYAHRLEHEYYSDALITR